MIISKIISENFFFALHDDVLLSLCGGGRARKKICSSGESFVDKYFFYAIGSGMADGR